MFEQKITLYGLVKHVEKETRNSFDEILKNAILGEEDRILNKNDKDWTEKKQEGYVEGLKAARRILNTK